MLERLVSALKRPVYVMNRHPVDGCCRAGVHERESNERTHNAKFLFWMKTRDLLSWIQPTRSVMMRATKTKFNEDPEYAILDLIASAFKDAVYLRVAAQLRQIERAHYIF